MDREIRRVPPNWQHPQEERFNPISGRMEPRYTPLHDRPYIAELVEWFKGHELWEAGKHPSQLSGAADCRYFAQWEGDPPRVDGYRPDWKDGEATWFQMYETVSEGTPVSPPFATQAELVDYLVAHGDQWDQKRRSEGCDIMPCDPWRREDAERFVYGHGYAPSLVIAGGRVMAGHEFNPDEHKKATE